MKTRLVVLTLCVIWLAGCNKNKAVSIASYEVTRDGARIAVGMGATNRPAGTERALSCNASPSGVCHIGGWRGDVKPGQKDAFDFSFVIKAGQSRPITEDMKSLTLCLGANALPAPRDCERSTMSVH